MVKSVCLGAADRKHETENVVDWLDHGGSVLRVFAVVRLVAAGAESRNDEKAENEKAEQYACRGRNGRHDVRAFFYGFHLRERGNSSPFMVAPSAWVKPMAFYPRNPRSQTQLVSRPTQPVPERREPSVPPTTVLLRCPPSKNS